MRAPYQILLFPYQKKGNEIFYALFKREDMDVWQGIAGGGELAKYICNLNRNRKGALPG